jgi:two-component system NtrC family response regulator
MASVRLLVIDDEMVICQGCQMILGEKGYQVDICLTGKSGLAAMQARTYDLLLLDMKLPDTDGLTLLDTVRCQHPSTYTIVMTGYSSVKNAVDAMKLGAYDYLAKPFADDELVMAVERAVESKKLVEENRSLRRQLHDRYNFSNIIGEHPRILEIFSEIEKVAPTDSTVLLEGESGTGKELFAGAIHAHSQRAANQFVAVDCNTFSAHLLESELFGHVKGAFTGAAETKAGIFEVADGGTLFLDEVANLGLTIQAKLLRVMESREFKPVGQTYPKKTDVRIIAATNRDLSALVDSDDFREDLFYRLNVLPILIPPLRERKEDIPRLAYHFLRVFNRETGKQVKGFSDDAMAMLVEYDWPGNVRQLKNAVLRLVIMADENVLDGAYLANHFHRKRLSGDTSIPDSIEGLKAVKKELMETRYGEIEKAFLIKALKECSGNVTQAAAQVGLRRTNFHARMKKHQLLAEQFRRPMRS